MAMYCIHELDTQVNPPNHPYPRDQLKNRTSTRDRDSQVLLGFVSHVLMLVSRSSPINAVRNPYIYSPRARGLVLDARLAYSVIYPFGSYTLLSVRLIDANVAREFLSEYARSMLRTTDYHDLGEGHGISQ